MATYRHGGRTTLQPWETQTVASIPSSKAVAQMHSALASALASGANGAQAWGSTHWGSATTRSNPDRPWQTYDIILDSWVDPPGVVEKSYVISGQTVNIVTYGGGVYVFGRLADRLIPQDIYDLVDALLTASALANDQNLTK